MEWGLHEYGGLNPSPARWADVRTVLWVAAEEVRPYCLGLPWRLDKLIVTLTAQDTDTDA